MLAVDHILIPYLPDYEAHSPQFERPMSSIYRRRLIGRGQHMSTANDEGIATTPGHILGLRFIQIRPMSSDPLKRNAFCQSDLHQSGKRSDSPICHGCGCRRV